ncbi:hypothetical protein [Antrihabitans spumae]|uniref:Uncharacterized protein n=1 Tax=Antrihabitans spumae TaxID=3373370 RepID=A0ABW7K5N1_9NOCA
MLRTTPARWAVALATVGASAMFFPGVASAAPPGLEANAVDNGGCKVTFSIDNRTNRSYTMDYWIDDEPLTGPDYGSGPTGRRPPLSAGVADGTPPTPYRRDIEPPFHTEKQVDLKAVENLPNPAAATHVVHYRVILGPESDDFVPEKTTTATGCAAAPPDTGSGSGSAGSSMTPAGLLSRIGELFS